MSRMQRNKCSFILVKRAAPVRRWTSRASLWRQANVLAAVAVSIHLAACDQPEASRAVEPAVDHALASRGPQNPALVAEGKTIFRFDTFGDQTFWTDTLRMHEVIRTSVSPNTALGVGLKVDAEALPPSVVAGIQDKSISLDAP